MSKSKSIGTIFQDNQRIEPRKSSKRHRTPKYRSRDSTTKSGTESPDPAQRRHTDHKKTTRKEGIERVT
jgi:hypothetical protein